MSKPVFRNTESNRQRRFEENDFPTSLTDTITINIYVGRIREDETRENGLLFYVLADNLRIGAASSSVAIMEYIINHQK